MSRLKLVLLLSVLLAGLGAFPASAQGGSWAAYNIEVDGVENEDEGSWVETNTGLLVENEPSNLNYVEGVADSQAMDGDDWQGEGYWTVSRTYSAGILLPGVTVPDITIGITISGAVTCEAGGFRGSASAASAISLTPTPSLFDDELELNGAAAYEPGEYTTDSNSKNLETEPLTAVGGPYTIQVIMHLTVASDTGLTGNNAAAHAVGGVYLGSSGAGTSH